VPAAAPVLPASRARRSRSDAFTISVRTSEQERCDAAAPEHGGERASSEGRPPLRLPPAPAQQTAAAPRPAPPDAPVAAPCEATLAAGRACRDCSRAWISARHARRTEHPPPGPIWRPLLPICPSTLAAPCFSSTSIRKPTQALNTRRNLVRSARQRLERQPRPHLTSLQGESDRAAPTRRLIR
jgi:hypothetical protein